MRQRTRLVAGAMAAAVMCTVVGATMASASPTAAPSTSASASATPGKDGGGIDEAKLAKVAASLHVTVQQLTTALVNLKKAIVQGTSPADALAAFAKELGVTVAQAKAALAELGAGKGKGHEPGSGVPEAAVQLLASELHISLDRARHVFTDLQKLPRTPGDITTNPGFVKIARGLGITPQQLATALIDVKRKLAGSAPTK